MHPNTIRRFTAHNHLLITLAILVFAAFSIGYCLWSPPSVNASATELFFSEYIEGSSNNKALEIFNGTGAPIDLAAQGYNVQMFFNGSTSAGLTINLTGTVVSGDVFVLAHGSANATILAQADQTNSAGWFNGDDAVVLRKGTTIIDVIGQIGFDPGPEWGSGLTSTADNTLRRKSNICAGDTNGSDAFDPSVEWDGFATDTFDGLGSHTSNCGGDVALSINDVSLNEGDAGTTTFTFTVSLSGPAPAGGVTFDIATQDGTATIADNDYVGKSLTGQTISEGLQTYLFEVTVNGDTNIEPNETFFVNVTNVTGATLSDGQGVGTILNDDSPPAEIVISQVYGGGGNAGATFKNDFIELYNRGTTTISLSGWSVQYTSSGGTGNWQVTPLSGSIAPNGYYLMQQAQGSGGTEDLPTPDATGTINMSATAGKVALFNTTTIFAGACPSGPGLMDLVGFGSTTCHEGSGPTAATANTTAALRKRGGCFDSNNNNIDFSIGSPNPRNTQSPIKTCDFIPAAIHDIQGNDLVTPFFGQDVSTSGIVTGLKTNGFFVQTPDADADADPATSQAIFVFTAAAPAIAVGDLVLVRGTATEFFNLTQVESTLPGDVTVSSTGNPLPARVTLTTSILDPNGPLTQLERFEGMLVYASSLVSVAPTNEFGETYTVLEGVARPMREPGIEASLPVPPDPTSGVPDCCIPIWDKNPERIMIDSDGLAGAPVVSVTSNVTFSNVTGPLDFTFGEYKILPETPPVPSGGMSAVPVPIPAANEFTVASFNIQNFNNNSTQRQKAGLAIRDVLRLPHVIGVAEIFDLADLQALAAEINSIASGVNYEAHLIEANGVTEDNDQDVGFLVDISRVQINSVIQEELSGCDGTAANCNTYINPNNNQPELLNDRPPLVLRATANPSGVNPTPIIVVMNHTRSFIGIETLTGDGPRVRAKRKAQSEFLASLLQDLQVNNPSTAVLSIGDYNAYQFNDGYTDPIATIKGTPTADEEVVVDESPDLVDPDLINLTDLLPAEERYSFIFQGTPQALDHYIVNTVAYSYLQHYTVARNNADFPAVPSSLFANDATRPERNSDHDIPVAYFKFPEAPTTTTVSNATAVVSSNDQSVTLNANVTTAVGAVNEGLVTFTVTDANNAIIGAPVSGVVSNGEATATYILPGGTQPQALTITGDFSGGDFTQPSTGTGTLSVTYAICLLYDPTKSVKQNGTIPIRIQLCDASGGNVSSAAVTVHALGISQVSDSASENLIEIESPSNPDNDFRFDQTLGGTGGYIYNARTTGLAGTYYLYFTAGSDPIVHTLTFQVRP